MEEAVRLLPSLDLPEPTMFPLAAFADALAAVRDGSVLKVVLVP
jgi:hypothetical protein